MPSFDNSNIVNLFIPCDMDMFSPMVAGSVMSVLEKLGLKVMYNESQTCCGRKFYIQGDVASAIDLGTKLMLEFDPQYPLIVPTTACVSYIRNYFRTLFANTHVPQNVKQFTSNVYELTDYIVNQRGVTKVGNFFNQRVFYFKSCSARNHYKLNDAPEILLRNTEGLVLLEDPEMNDCCSANGNFSIANPATSDLMIEQIVTKIYGMGAQYVTSTDIHCLQHMDAFIQSKGIGLEVIHIADILNADKE